MSIFDNPILAANWLRTCEADKLRKDTARYEASQDLDTECVGCGVIFPEGKMENGACSTCWEGLQDAGCGDEITRNEDE